jgi:amino acid transporter
VGAVAAATTVLKIAALAIVAVAGLLAFRAGDVRPVRAHGGSWTPLRSSPPCCFSFLGMEGAAMATNRVRDPESNVPRAIIAGVAGVAVLYLAGTLAVLGTVPQTRLAESGAPPCEGDRSDRQCRCAEAVQRGALLILIGIPVYVRAAHGGAPRGTDRGNDEH